MRVFSTVALLFVAVGLLVAACGGGGGGSANLPAGVVVDCNGTQIKKTQVDRLLAQARRSYKAQKRPFPKAGTPEYRQLLTQAVQFLVQRCQFAQAASKRGINVTNADVEKRLKQIKKQYFGGSEKRYRAALKQQGITDAQVRDDVKAQLISEKLFNRITEDIKVAENDVRKYYDEHPELYSQPETRDVRHILVKQKARANSLYSQLCGSESPCVKAKTDFAALAKRFSIDPGSKNQGGKLTVTRGQTVPEFDKKAFELKKNEISSPVKTQYGFHIIQALSAVRPRRTTPYKQVKEAIRQQLVSQKKTEAQQKFLDDLKKEYEDKIKYAKGYEPPPTTTAPTTTAPTTTATTTSG
jgi:parvulin-like peptidyl-prolyl isomerase